MQEVERRDEAPGMKDVSKDPKNTAIVVKKDAA